MDDIRYNEALKRFWIATRDPDEDWDDVDFWDLPMDEREKIKEDMEYEMQLERSYNEKVAGAYWDAM